MSEQTGDSAETRRAAAAGASGGGGARHPTEHHRTRSDTRRAEAFADAVMAIVITLLVLELRPPDVPPGRLLQGLLAQWPTYLAYVTSYFFVAVVWLNHKAAFMHITRMDRPTHWANLLILFSVALVPFPTAVISHTMERESPVDVRVAVAMYALVGTMLCASWVVFFRHIARHPELLHAEYDREYFAGETTRAWTGVLGYVLAGVLGYAIAPGIALAIFLALPIFYGLTSHGLRRFAGRSRRRAAGGGTLV